MASEVVEEWLRDWCEAELGAVPVKQLMAASVMSDVTALRLTDGREVVVKRRPDPTGRATTCLAVQATVAAAGLPCARLLTEVKAVDGFAVHAEEWLPGGESERATDGAAAERSARLYAAVTRVTSRLKLPPPLPNPEWVRWDHDGPGYWPPNALHDRRPGADSLPGDLVTIAGRARKRLLASTLQHVLGHADWEAQNLRWNGSQPHVVHDWDSIAWLPEAALAGAASGAFASNETPTLAPPRQLRGVPRRLPARTRHRLHHRRARDRLGSQPLARPAQRPRRDPLEPPTHRPNRPPQPGRGPPTTRRSLTVQSCSRVARLAAWSWLVEKSAAPQGMSLWGLVVAWA